jgi:hypothetical protein
MVGVGRWDRVIGRSGQGSARIARRRTYQSGTIVTNGCTITRDSVGAAAKALVRQPLPSRFTVDSSVPFWWRS